jgi:hypothetical protein
MRCPNLVGLLEIKKTLSRSQTQIFKGVEIAKNNCNPHAFGVFSIVVKLEISNGFLKKCLSLPNKRPSEF